MKTIAAAVILLACLVTFGFGQKVKAKDLDRLAGAQWNGALTYRDYSSGKSVTISCDLVVTRTAGKNNSWDFSYIYPKEPKANAAETVILSADGKNFDNETVIERVRLKDKTIKIVTRKAGTDNDKKAIFRFTYLIAEKSFSIKKEVKYDDGDAGFFERNQYTWAR